MEGPSRDIRIIKFIGIGPAPFADTMSVDRMGDFKGPDHGINYIPPSGALHAFEHAGSESTQQSIMAAISARAGRRLSWAFSYTLKSTGRR